MSTANMVGEQKRGLTSPLRTITEYKLMYWHFKHHWPRITYTHVSQTQTIIHVMNLTDDALNGLNIQKSCACIIHTVTARTSLEYKTLHSTLTVQSGHSLHTGNINFNPLLPSSCLDVVREAKLRPSLGLAVQDFSSLWDEFTDFFNPPPLLPSSNFGTILKPEQLFTLIFTTSYIIYNFGTP